jgi:preprotein translocase subunit YajC
MSTAFAVLFAATTTKSSSSGFTLFFVLIAAYALVYFFFLRPRQKRAKEQRQSRSTGYELGDEVMTVGGLIGTISSMDDRTITIRVDSSTEMRFVKEAIKQRYVEPDASDPEPDDAPDAGTEDEGH